MSETENFKSRADILNHAVNGLFLMNGAAAVGLLSFVGSGSSQNKKLIIAVVDNIYLFAIGVSCAVLVHFIRFYRAFFNNTATEYKSADIWTVLWSLSAFASLLCFALGVTFIGNDAATAFK